MSVAVPARDGLVDAHFGHCEHFLVYSLDTKRKSWREGHTQSDSRRQPALGNSHRLASQVARVVH